MVLSFVLLVLSLSGIILMDILLFDQRILGFCIHMYFKFRNTKKRSIEPDNSTLIIDLPDIVSVETKTCKQCAHWWPCMKFDDQSKFKVCTNKKVFINKPDTIRQSELIHRGDYSGIYTTDNIYHAMERSKTEPIVTGENFGCIHFEQKDPNQNK